MYPLISTFIQVLNDKSYFHHYLGTKGQVCQMKAYLSLQKKNNGSRVGLLHFSHRGV